MKGNTMKKMHIFANATAISLIALMLTGNPALAQYAWTNNTPSGTPKPWETASNWDSMPPNPADEQVVFSYGYSSMDGSFTVSLASDKQLNNGMLFNWARSFGRLMTLDLGGYSLQLNGSEMLIEPRSGTGGLVNFLTFSNGNVVLDNGAALTFGKDYGAGVPEEGEAFVTQFDSTSIFDTKNASTISIATATGNNDQSLILDLSDAAMNSGETEKKLAVNNSLIIGTRSNSGNTTRTTRGLLKLGVVSEISIGDDLILGKNARRTSNLEDTRAYGTLEFSDKLEQGAVNLSIGKNLLVGVGVGIGTLDQTPELNVTIGSETTRGETIQVGVKTSGSNDGSGAGDANGNFSTGPEGGSISAWVTSLSIGRSQATTTGSVTGTMDFGSATLGVLDVSGDAIIGQGTNAVGTLILSGGSASSAKLIVGDSTSSTRSLVELNDTVWTVNDSLLLGAKGDITVTVNTTSGAGISLLSTNEADFSILTGGVMTINFEAKGWGLRMLGENHADLFNSYLGSGLIAAGSLSSQAEIYTDGGFTYFGVTPIPEPTAMWLLLVAPLGILLRRRRH